MPDPESDAQGLPLPSSSGPGPAPLATRAEDEDDDGEDDEPEPARPPSRPPAPTFHYSWTTSVYVFLGLLGILMLFDTSARNQIADLLGVSRHASGPLYVAIGFGSNDLLVTMALAGAVEMLITSLAYNYTTDWIKAAKVQKWSSAFRKVQMEAIRSGKKDRIASLRPHQERLTRLSSEVTIAQFKGMAITYFLLILIYTWVGLVIFQANSVQQTVSLGGAGINLSHTLWGPIPYWFIIFSLYTVPFSLVFRRALKHVWLREYERKHPPAGPPARPLTPAGRSA